MQQARQILKKTFGFDEFRPLQEEVISNVVQGKDCLVIMPTGGGKSLCFQIPALLADGLTLVVSPLISLMQDQVAQLRQLDIAAGFLNSTLSASRYEETLQDVKNGRLQLLYLAPETLLKPRVLSTFTSAKIAILAIDEAHCISEWGHDFRKEYRQLATVRTMFDGAVCMALTATATPMVRQDILTSLSLQKAGEFIGSFNRTNLLLQVEAKQRPMQQLENLLKDFADQSGIIYCATRRQVDELTRHLIAHGFSAGAYHAGLADVEREKNQQAFSRDDLQIIVATIAFGMGIDKPNVRFVIHFDLPKNIEGYYQEIGRAGRDGLEARCVLLFSYSDIHKIRHFINQKDAREKRIAQMQMNAMVAYAETNVCRRQPLLSYFGEKPDSSKRTGGCRMCDNCLAGERQLEDLTIPAQKFLSCVKRTGELFGANHIIDVLRGSTNRKVALNKHHELSTYGIGKELSRRQWFHLARQCLQHGLLEQDETYGGLKLTAKAWPLLRGKQALQGVLLKDDVQQKRAEPKREADYDDKLFALLRTKRKELADQANVPPYAVFADRTLIEMSALLPQTPGELADIHGVGRIKLQRYGETFLGLIRLYCKKNGIGDNLGDAAADADDSNLSAGLEEPLSVGRKPRYREVGELFCSGLSLRQCMDTYEVKLDTILNHLRHYQAEGHTLPPEGLRETLTIGPEDRQQVLRLLTETDGELLGPVHQALNGRVGYADLKLMQMLFFIEKRKGSLEAGFQYNAEGTDG
jgi:ATP-dependent DNA helicase RecQ